MRRTLGLALSIFIPTLMTRPEKTSPSTMLLSPASEPPPGNRLIFTNFRMSIDFLLASSGGLTKTGSLAHNLLQNLIFTSDPANPNVPYWDNIVVVNRGRATFVFHE